MNYYAVFVVCVVLINSWPSIVVNTKLQVEFLSKTYLQIYFSLQIQNTIIWIKSLTRKKCLLILLYLPLFNVDDWFFQRCQIIEIFYFISQWNGRKLVANALSVILIFCIWLHKYILVAGCEPYWTATSGMHVAPPDLVIHNQIHNQLMITILCSLRSPKANTWPWQNFKDFTGLLTSEQMLIRWCRIKELECMIYLIL